MVFIEGSPLINTGYTLRDRGPRKQSIKDGAFILSKDKDRFLEIAEATSLNMLRLVEDESTYKKLRSIQEQFEATKMGA